MSCIAYCDADGIVYIDENGNEIRKQSAFIDNYKNAAEQTRRDNEWKHSGFGAQFTQTDAVEVPPEKYTSSINGLYLQNDDTLYYSATVENSSGIFSLIPQGEKQPEGHIIHNNNVEYGDIDVDASGRNLVTSVKTDVYTRNLAVFSLSDGDYTVITGGDSKDEHPSFSRCNNRKILFSTAGIGRDASGNFVRYAISSICAYDMSSRNITDIHSDPKHSLIQPKQDKNGDIYFIERPPKEKLKKPNIFLEILLIPFRLIYAIYKFLEAFTRIFTGKGFTTKTEGDNPSKQKSERDLIVDGYKIQAQKNLNKCIKRKEKYPGYAPHDWILKKLSKDGAISEMAKGVIAYSLTDDGQIVYTNGKAIIEISQDGSKRKLNDCSLALKVAANRNVDENADRNTKDSNPFDL